MIHILVDDHRRQQPGAGQSARDGLGRLGGQYRRQVTVRAAVLEADMVDHLEGGRLVVELRRALLADLAAFLATARAQAFDGRQVMLAAFVRQVRGQLLAAVAAPPSRGRPGRGVARGGRRVVVGRGRVGLAVQEGGEQGRLVGVPAFGARAIEAAQPLVQALAEVFVIPALRLEAGQQFADHRLEEAHVIGQSVGVQGGSVRRGGHDRHAY